MSRRRGLGSGLDALIPSGSPDAPGAVRQIPVVAVRQNRSQPRTRFDEQALEELAESIRAHGVIQPIIVSEDASGGYELIAGERRWRAAQRAGLSEVPALIKAATPQQLLELALVENVQRQDLNPLEEGLAYQTLKDEFGLTDETIAQRVGKSRVAVANTRRLIKLAPRARQAILDGTISAGHGRALLRFESAPEQESALDLLLQGELTVRDVERLGELAQHPLLTPVVRLSLLNGTISVAQAQTLLRIEDQQQQGDLLDRALDLGLGAGETSTVADLLTAGMSLDTALDQIRPNERPPVRREPRQAGHPGTSAESEGRAKRQSPLNGDDVARLFEELLETPVRLARSGREIRLTITVFSEEQLQGLYERLRGENA